MNNPKTLELLKKLINCPSVTPNDAGCQDIIQEELEALGFIFTPYNFGNTQNLWAQRGDGNSHFMFAGHTDVVPAGDLKEWESNPFAATMNDDKLYGRGAADMKGGIAAMLVAVQKFIAQNPDFPGTISFLITSDEEGPATDGTIKVLEQLKKDKIKVDWCIVGEPVSQKILADTMKLGSRGSLHGNVTFFGKQGHVGHANRAINPIHKVLPALDALTQVKWDEETSDFPATSLQITKLIADSSAENVIPNTVSCRFNLRFSPNVQVADIKDKITTILDKEQPLEYKIDWRTSGMPYLSKRGKLTELANDIVTTRNETQPEIRSVGGTSDARFIVKELDCETLELGLMDTTMHEINEHVPIADLDKLTDIYFEILEGLFKK